MDAQGNHHSKITNVRQHKTPAHHERVVARKTNKQRYTTGRVSRERCSTWRHLERLCNAVKKDYSQQFARENYAQFFALVSTVAEDRAKWRAAVEYVVNGANVKLMGDGSSGTRWTLR